MKKFLEFLKYEEGSTAVEYGIMVAGIAVVIIAVVMEVGGKTFYAFRTLNKAMFLLGGHGHGR